MFNNTNNRKINCIQINLHKSKLASENLCKTISDNNSDIIVIQEPWVYQNRVCGLNQKHFKLL